MSRILHSVIMLHLMPYKNYQILRMNQISV